MPGNFCCGLILLTYCDYEFCVSVYFRHRFHQKVPVLHVCLVVMAGNCFWCILEEMFLVVWRVYNGRLCGRSFSWTSGEVVAVRRVGVFFTRKICVSQMCVCGVVIYRWDPSWYGNFASDWGIAVIGLSELRLYYNVDLMFHVSSTANQTIQYAVKSKPNV